MTARLDAAAVLPTLGLGDGITLRELHNTHPPREWIVRSRDGDHIRAEGLAYPGASRTVTFEFRLCRKWNGLRRVTRRGTGLFHMFASAN